MLVCPQCQFENPDTNKFCQKCGVSLTEVVCPGCEATVPSDVESCPNCGTATGVVWRALILPTLNQAEETAAAELATSANSSTELTRASDKYLDPQNRYQLLEPLLEISAAASDIEVKVLDCQPYQPTALDLLQKQKDLQAESSSTASPVTLLSTEVSVDNEVLTVPGLAQTYLELQSESHPALPQIHDAWEQDGRVVVVLEDRSDLPLLADIWEKEDILPLQMLHWFYQMTELWALLESHSARQSLLELGNLRVDEDQLLRLQKLIFEKPDRLPELKDLGRLWQLLFQISQRTQLGPLARLCQNLESGELVALDQLRSQFETIANELQPTSAQMSPAQPLQPDIAPEYYQNPEPSSDPTLELPSSLQPPAAVEGEAYVGAADISVSTSSTRLELGNLEDDGSNDRDDVPTVVLPMKLISIEDAGRSDVGRQRQHNEDSFCIEVDFKKLEGPSSRTLQVKGLYILCDGMGGHAGGEVASALAVETLKKYFEENWKDQLPDEQRIREAIYLANKVIYDLNQENDRSGSGRMGTTLVMVLIHDTQAAIAHVGDSRLYRFSRRRGLEQVTVDHEVGQREIQRGVEPAIAYARPDAYQLTQALGPRDENFVNPDVQFLELNEDLLLLLCSDGLTDNDLLETHWRTHLEPLLSSQTYLEQGVNQLIDLANHYNGHDNITAVVIRTKVRPNLEQLKRS